MKRSLITFGILFSLCLSMGLFTACSTEEEQAQPQQNLVNLAAKGKIILSMQDFNTAREITRAVQAPTDTQVVDLDNGMTAEISVERGRKRKTAATRASDIYDGHFNLYALNPATNQRVGNVLRGTISRVWVPKPTPLAPWAGENVTTFTPDAGLSPLMLAPGTYKFVCYNDAVEDDGTNLTIKNGVNNPLIGSTTATIPANSIEYKVDIEMKHPAVQCLVSLKNLIGNGEPTAGFVNMKGRLIATPTKAIQYSADLTSKTVIPGTDILEFSFTESEYDPDKDWALLYVLPLNGTDMKLEFYNGTCYYKSVGTLKTSLAKLGTMSANDNYKLNIKINPSYEYLFNNGTTGYLRDKGTRTPIGIVVRRKTAGKKGLAVALNQASTSREQPFTYTYDISGEKTYYANKRAFTKLTDAFTDMDGYAYTWNANTSTNNEVKAGSDKYLAFKLAANYNPGVPTSGIGKWFLPSLGQIKLMLATIGFSYKWYSNEVTQPFANAALAYGFRKATPSNPPLDLDDALEPICSSTYYKDDYCWTFWYHHYDTYSEASVLPFVEF